MTMVHTEKEILLDIKIALENNLRDKIEKKYLNIEEIKQRTKIYENVIKSLEFLPKADSTKQTDETKLIRNIHVSKDGVKFTHSNDIDVVINLELHDFVNQGTYNNSGLKKYLNTLNLSTDSLELYNSEIIYNRSYNETISAKSQIVFYNILTALCEIGYTIEESKSKYWTFHIIRLSKA